MYTYSIYSIYSIYSTYSTKINSHIVARAHKTQNQERAIAPLGDNGKTKKVISVSLHAVLKHKKTQNQERAVAPPSTGTTTHRIIKIIRRRRRRMVPLHSFPDHKTKSVQLCLWTLGHLAVLADYYGRKLVPWSLASRQR